MLAYKSKNAEGDVLNPLDMQGVQVEEWKRRMADIPDLRINKVMRLRRAISSDAYEENNAIEKVIGEIENEVGVLCREDY